MYLKSITLQGFKSFGKKSRLFFEPGVGVIVGPNGSGKSNIADAISWVLGQQSPKSLRSVSMGDIIFRSKSEEMGIAEVSLLFDNSDRTIDVEFRDVKITRRVYSEGGSEYFINSSPSRLFDIQDMMADTGIGKGLHTIINQGQIDEIAVLKPEERKMMIDEVLGISKHKIRRNKAIARLLKVKDDIARVDDLTDEIRRTMDPLEIEAKRAKEYAKISNALKQEEVSLILTNISGLNNTWDNQNQAYREIEDKLLKVNEAISELEALKDSLLKSEGSNMDEYDSWKNRIDIFNSEKNNLMNLIALVESKKNVFSTLLNMFEIKFEEEPGAAEGSGQLSGGKVVDLGFLQSIIKRIKSIEELFRKFQEKIREILVDKKINVDIDGETGSIQRQLSELLDLVREEDLPSSKEKDKALKTSGSAPTHAGRDSRIDKVKTIKKFCALNLERSKKMAVLLKAFTAQQKNIGKRLYPEFEKRQKMISGNQEKINGINGKIMKLESSRSGLENNLYKIDLKKEQIKDNVKTISTIIVDNYNLSIEYAAKNFKPCEDTRESEVNVRRLKNELRSYGNINPNAAIEFGRIKKRYDFLIEQKTDLKESKEKLETLIMDINKRISDFFHEKFEDINQSFKYYFKTLFPNGEGEMQLEKGANETDDDIGVDLKVDIGNNKLVSLSLLSGGEKALVSLAFLFSIFSINPSPFYIFDEADAALDDVNLDRFLSMVRKFSKKQQIILVTHQKKTMEIAETIYGITMQSDGISKVIAEKINKEKKEDAKIN